MKTFALALCATLCAGPSLADLRVQFLEGAPKDRFVITNQSTCALGRSDLLIDFSKTGAGLIFDVTAAGAGVEVFQPFEVTAGAALFEALPVIADGDQTATLAIKTLGAGQQIAFTIDVDDASGAREITVSAPETDGAVIALTTDGAQVSSGLDANGEALLPTTACSS